MTATGDLFDVHVGPVAHGGHFVARHQGQVVFVRHALPGERVRVRVTEVRRGYLRADVVDVLAGSTDRVVPPCPYAGPGRCGGCDFQHVAPEAQRRLKADVVKEQLLRLGGLTAADLPGGFTVEALPGGPLGWRTRMRYAVSGEGRVGLRRHRSHGVVPVDRCQLAVPEIQTPPPVGDRWHGTSGVLVVRGVDGRVTVCRERSQGLTRVTGPAEVTEHAVGRDWRLRPDAFWQVHPAAVDTLVNCVLDLLRPVPDEHAWDLYGGAGLFAVALATRVGPGGRVITVESDPTSDPRGKLDDLPQIRAVRGRVEQILARRAMRHADLVVLDPPRSGAGADVVRRIVAAGPRAVAYVACDPAALARDVAAFRGLGWRLAELRGFDMFPMTHHVECVGLLLPSR
ncbi:MAG TPA: TRAM domain-containing protein [Micromonosporaceae bacterium]|jgi:tRNA/tmRNA/rRNA uracil-C5-methylase (TrmA/RlmC/RlmD family)|nr:TRAM domain-containing protein [Micromonosporaceae bacterium]